METREIGLYLKNASLSIFEDFDNMLPGENHQEVIDNALSHSACVVVIIGKGGLGPWQRSEVAQGIWDSIKNHKHVIPLLLPGASINAENVPGHLKNLNNIWLTEKVDEPNSISKLIEAIQSYSITFVGNMHPFSLTEIQSHIDNTHDAYDDEQFANYFYEKWRKEIPENKLDLFLKNIKGGSYIMDAGCGPGHHTSLMKKSGYNIIGIDFAYAPLKIAKQIYKGIDFVKHDMTNLIGLDHIRYEGLWVCASCVHTHKEYFTKQLWEFNRVLRQNGLLGLTILINQPCHFDKNKRFFEGWLNTNEIIQHLGITNFDCEDVSVEHVENSTDGEKRISDWATIICRKVQPYINPSAVA